MKKKNKRLRFYFTYTFFLDLFWTKSVRFETSYTTQYGRIVAVRFRVKVFGIVSKENLR